MVNDIRNGSTDFGRCAYGFLVTYLSGERNLSPLTIKSYGLTLKLFIGYINEVVGIAPERIELRDITVDRVKACLDNMEAINNISPTTRNQRLAALKTFTRYALREYPAFLMEGQRILALSSKRCPTSEINYLEKDAMKALLATPDQNVVRGRRDLAILALLYDSGARVQEVIDLLIKDIRLIKPATVTLTGKGGKTRTVPIMDETVEILKSYFIDRGVGKQEVYGNLHIFSSPNRSRFTRPGISKILKKHFSTAKDNNPTISFPTNIHPHALRASKAIHLLEAGVNIIIIRDFLGHVSVSTTQMYLRVNNEIKKEAIMRAYPALGAPVPAWDKDNDLMSFLKEICS